MKPTDGLAWVSIVGFVFSLVAAINYAGEMRYDKSYKFELIRSLIIMALCIIILFIIEVLT